MDPCNGLGTGLAFLMIGIASVYVTPGSSVTVPVHMDYCAEDAPAPLQMSGTADPLCQLNPVPASAIRTVSFKPLPSLKSPPKAEDTPVHSEVDTMEFRPTDARDGDFGSPPF